MMSDRQEVLDTLTSNELNSSWTTYDAFLNELNEYDKLTAFWVSDH